MHASSSVTKTTFQCVDQMATPTKMNVILDKHPANIRNIYQCYQKVHVTLIMVLDQGKENMKDQAQMLTESSQSVALANMELSVTKTQKMFGVYATLTAADIMKTQCAQQMETHTKTPALSERLPA